MRAENIARGIAAILSFLPSTSLILLLALHIEPMLLATDSCHNFVDQKRAARGEVEMRMLPTCQQDACCRQSGQGKRKGIAFS
jgi:hypothetical protein